MTLTAQPHAGSRESGRLAVDLAGVVKRFGAVTAVDGIDLRIRAGEVVALLGPNGAGKTSTVDMLLGLSKPTEGTVQVYGRPPQEAVALGLVSAVMQTGGLLKDYTVEETVKLTAVLFGRPMTAVDEALERAGIAEVRKRLVGKCSGGQQQRLRFAMALLPDPELLILDEPTTGMDVGGRHDFWTAIREDARGGSYGHLRHPLPGGSRRVRGPGGLRAPRPRRRRRHRGRGQSHGVRAHHPGHHERPERGRPAGPSAGSSRSRCAATPCCCTPGTPMRLPGTC